MRLRLPHVLALMVLILAAGVVSVRELQSRRGPPSVPGLVVVDAPWLDGAALQPLLGSWPEARSTWARADDEPVSPFGTGWVVGRTVRGARAVLVAPRESEELGPPPAAFATVLDGGGDGLGGALTLANHLTDHAGSLPFVAVLPLPASERPRLDQIVRTLQLAMAQLPSFRRTSLVVLGVREPDGGRRLALRFDTGRWPGARPGLLDLLEDTW
jgi:hypothetical protein